MKKIVFGILCFLIFNQYVNASEKFLKFAVNTPYVDKSQKIERKLFQELREVAQLNSSNSVITISEVPVTAEAEIFTKSFEKTRGYQPKLFKIKNLKNEYFYYMK